MLFYLQETAPFKLKLLNDSAGIIKSRFLPKIVRFRRGFTFVH